MGIYRGKLFDDSSDEEDNNKENENGSPTKDHVETWSIENKPKNLFGNSGDDDEDEDDNKDQAREENKDVHKDVLMTKVKPLTGQDWFCDDSSNETNNDHDDHLKREKWMMIIHNIVLSSKIQSIL